MGDPVIEYVMLPRTWNPRTDQLPLSDPHDSAEWFNAGPTLHELCLRHALGNDHGGSHSSMCYVGELCSPRARAPTDCEDVGGDVSV